MSSSQPVLPDYRGACVSSLVPALMGRRPTPWLPAAATAAEQVVLLVVDGLGWQQLQERSALRPALAAGERFVYAYYDGIDRIAHEFGLDEHYEAELVAVDRLVADLVALLPAGAALVVTADHGQVDVGDNVVHLDEGVLAETVMLSGEGRFRWLHTAGDVDALAELARAAHGEHAWVCTRDEAEAHGWFGGPLPPEAASRL